MQGKIRGFLAGWRVRPSGSRGTGGRTAGGALRPVLTLRTERWTDGSGDETFLLAAAFASSCSVHAFRVDLADGRLWAASEHFHEGAILAERESLASCLSWERATASGIDGLGILDGETGDFGTSVRMLAYSIASRQGYARRCPGEVYFGPKGGGPLQTVLLRIRRDPPDRWDEGAPRIDIPFEDQDVLVRPDTAGAVDALVRDWHAALVGLARPEGLPPRGWTGETYAFLDVPRAMRQRRVQALALQPLFAGELCGDEGLAALVDAGRPFEGELARTMLGDPVDGMARMRRLRSYPQVPPQMHEEKGRVLRAAKILPLSRIPASAAGWGKVDLAWHRVIEFAHGYGLPLAPILAGQPADWDVRGLTGSTADPRDLHEVARAEILDACDPAIRLCEAILVPAAGRGALDAGEHGAVLTMAARMLYGGRTMRGILRTSRDWHAGLGRTGAALPGGDGPPWQPLFGPATVRGLSLRCLTTERELRDEGTGGVDDDGVLGLDHCVAGYADRCRTGRTHIVSVSRGEGRARRRLSTAQIDVDHGIPELVQHRGRGNTIPPDVAEGAIEDLMESLREGVVSIPADPPAAPRPRDAMAHVDIEAAVAAWRPYLTAAGRERADRIAAAMAGGREAA